MTTTHTTGTESVLRSLRAFIPQRRATFTEARRIAEQQAQRLLHRLGIDQAPVSEELLRELPRLHIEIAPGMPTSGCSFWDTERQQWVIQVNGDEPWTRQRFTLFHEYKHIIDHGRAHLLYGTGDNAQLRAEQAADYFAGCVLIPRPLLKRAWCDGIQTNLALARHFEVSVPAIGVRLAQVGLVDETPRCSGHSQTLPRQRRASYPYRRSPRPPVDNREAVAA